jgi:hypothetical protein
MARQCHLPGLAGHDHTNLPETARVHNLQGTSPTRRTHLSATNLAICSSANFIV